MTDWKARCAELMATLETHYPAEIQGHYFTADLCDVLDRTRAELAQAEPEGPTDEELTSFATEWWASFAYLERGADEATPINEIIHSRHFVDFLKDAFARLPISKASDL